MAGFLIMQDDDQFEFHVGTFPGVNPRDVKAIQLDCDELALGLNIWPEAAKFTNSPNYSRVMSWYGASARRFVCKFLDREIGPVAMDPVPPVPDVRNKISHDADSLGVREMPDALDSGGCHLRCSSPAVVRVNTGGVYTSLCVEHRDALVHFLSNPLPKGAR